MKLSFKTGKASSIKKRNQGLDLSPVTPEIKANREKLTRWHNNKRSTECATIKRGKTPTQNQTLITVQELTDKRRGSKQRQRTIINLSGKLPKQDTTNQLIRRGNQFIP